MRLRISEVLECDVHRHALRNGLSDAQMAERLLREGICARDALPTTRPIVEEPESGFVKNRMLIRVHNDVRVAIDKLAAEEDRPLSSMCRRLLREALVQRGIVPALNALSPVAT